jgi:uncharacterized protein
MTSVPSSLSAQLATAHRFVDALKRRDREAQRQCFTDDFVWHIPGISRVSGDYHGWPALLEFAGLLRALSDGTFRSETLDVLAGEHSIVLYQRNTAERQGKRLDLRTFYLLEFDGDRIAAGRAFYEDQAQLTEFWA